MNTTKIIDGTWSSSYEYNAGSKEETLVSKHTIRFIQRKDKWVGISIPNEEGSELYVELSMSDDREYSGTWVERTSSGGIYHGQEFEGLVMFVLQKDDKTLSGMWLGASSKDSDVKSGNWKLKRK